MICTYRSFLTLKQCYVDVVRTLVTEKWYFSNVRITLCRGFFYNILKNEVFSLVVLLLCPSQQSSKQLFLYHYSSNLVLAKRRRRFCLYLRPLVLICHLSGFGCRCERSRNSTWWYTLNKRSKNVTLKWTNHIAFHLIIIQTSHIIINEGPAVSP